MHVSVNLQWEPSQAKDLAGYRIYWSAKDSVLSHVLVPKDVTARLLVADLHPMLRYVFLVSSYDVAGNESAKRILMNVFVAG